ncbi:MAG: AcvB/VirJ family lysyl-phosphatidylglycerol hydrolase [Gammaproteobacteria bacterium]
MPGRDRKINFATVWPNRLDLDQKVGLGSRNLASFQGTIDQVCDDKAVQAEDVKDLPLVEVLSKTKESDTFIVILSGNGGWAGIDRELGDAFVQKGIPVVGLNSLQYFWTPRTPEGFTKDLERVLRYYKAAWRKDHVMLVGYSQGADVLPFAIGFQTICRAPFLEWFSWALRNARTLNFISPIGLAREARKNPWRFTACHLPAPLEHWSPENRAS